MNLERTSFSNARLLSLTRFWGEDLASVLQSWKEQAIQIPGIKIPDSKVILYFFKPAIHDEFIKTPFWFSKSVIGFVPENDQFKIIDLDAGECWESEEFEVETYDQLITMAQKIQTSAQDEGLQCADTWAVLLDEGSLCQKAKIRLFYENK